MALSAPTDPAPGPSFDRLTPTTYLDRAAEAHSDRIAAVNGKPVAVLAPNTHLLLEASFGLRRVGGKHTHSGQRTGADTNHRSREYR